MVGYKTSLSKCKTVEKPSVVSHQNGTELEINTREMWSTRRYVYNIYIYIYNSTFLNNQWFAEKTTRKIRKYFEMNMNETKT